MDKQLHTHPRDGKMRKNFSPSSEGGFQVRTTPTLPIGMGKVLAEWTNRAEPKARDTRSCMCILRGLCSFIAYRHQIKRNSVQTNRVPTLSISNLNFAQTKFIIFADKRSGCAFTFRKRDGKMRIERTNWTDTIGGGLPEGVHRYVEWWSLFVV